MEQREISAVAKPGDMDSSGPNEVQIDPTVLIADLMTEYQRISVYVAPYQARLDELKAAIVEGVKGLGASFEHGAVKAIYKPGYKRGSWDGRGLLSYAKDHPEVSQFWCETDVAASVSIKLGQG